MLEAPQSRTAVFLGVSDWRHPEWSGAFYPPDLPADWGLTFFNTQFSCVWLPYPAWSSLSSDEVRAWFEDTHDGFYFVLEHHDPLSAEEADLVKAFGRLLGRFCRKDDPALVWFGRHPDVKAIAARVQAATVTEPVFLLSENADLAGIEQVRTLLELLGA